MDDADPALALRAKPASGLVASRIDRGERLRDLAERCEKANAPDRELDLAISVAVNFRDIMPTGSPGEWRWSVFADELELIIEGKRRAILDPAQFAPHWTRSIDAAMTLADGLERFGGAGGMLREAMDRMTALPAMISQMSPDQYRQTLARFLTAACLRARDTDRSGEADETAKQAQPEARAGAGDNVGTTDVIGGIAQPTSSGETR